MWMHGPFGGFPWMWLLPAAFVAAVIFIAIRLSSGSAGGIEARGKEENARDVIDRRYARGEISREEHQRMTRDVER